MAKFPRYLSTFNRTDEEDPLKNFRWLVEVSGFARFGFSKCTGLKATTDVIVYRGTGQNTTEQKSPGQTKFPEITLERGQIIAPGYGPLDMLTWYKAVFDASAKRPKSSPSFRRTLEFVQQNKEGNEVLRWSVPNCWPKDHNAFSDLDALGSANSIESLVLVHEGYTLKRSKIG